VSSQPTLATGNCESVHQDTALTEKVSPKEMISYGLGCGASGVTQFAVSSFSTFFFTDIAGIGAAAVGLILMVGRIFDFFADFTMGAIIDRTNSRWGKVRPWFLWSAIPFSLGLMLLFTMPNFSSETAKVVYAFFTYNFATVICFTMYMIPQNAFLAMATSIQFERSKLEISSGIVIMGFMLVIGFVINPLVEAFGGGKSGWFATFAILSVVILIFHIIAFAGTKERVKAPAKPKINFTNFKDELTCLLKNKYWIMLVARTFLVSMNTGMVALVYYTKYVVMDMGVLGYMFALTMAPTIAGLVLSPIVIKKFGKRNVSLGGALLTVISYLGIIAIPGSWVLYIGLALSSFAQAAMTSTQNSMIADTVEYGEWKTGVRTVGFSYSVFNMVQKFGQAVQAAFFGLLLAIGGYISVEGAVQPESAIAMIKASFIYIPLISAALQAIILYFYKLEKEYPQIIAELNARKANEECQ